MSKKQNILESFEYLDKNSISYSYLIPTRTGLHKSIIDAIYSLRLYFLNEKFHNYNLQPQGKNNKIIKKL